MLHEGVAQTSAGRCAVVRELYEVEVMLFGECYKRAARGDAQYFSAAGLGGFYAYEGLFGIAGVGGGDKEGMLVDEGGEFVAFVYKKGFLELVLADSADEVSAYARAAHAGDYDVLYL